MSGGGAKGAEVEAVRVEEPGEAASTAGWLVRGCLSLEGVCDELLAAEAVAEAAVAAAA